MSPCIYGNWLNDGLKIVQLVALKRKCHTRYDENNGNRTIIINLHISVGDIAIGCTRILVLTSHTKLTEGSWKKKAGIYAIFSQCHSLKKLDFYCLHLYLQHFVVTLVSGGTPVSSTFIRPSSRLWGFSGCWCLIRRWYDFDHLFVAKISSWKRKQYRNLCSCK